MAKREGSPWVVLSGPSGVLAQLCGLFMLGGVAGCLYAGLAASDGAFALRDFLTDYLALTGADRLSPSLWPLLWAEFRWLLAIALLGFTALGSMGVPALFFVRGFLFSFSVGCFCRVFGWPGLLPALALFGLPALMWAPAFFWAGIQSLCGARFFKQRFAPFVRVEYFAQNLFNHKDCGEPYYSLGIDYNPIKYIRLQALYTHKTFLNDSPSRNVVELLLTAKF